VSTAALGLRWTKAKLSSRPSVCRMLAVPPAVMIGAKLASPPTCAVHAAASSGSRRASSSAIARRNSPRTEVGIRGHGPSSKAWRAAATARSMSAAVPSATRPTTASLFGQISSIASSPLGSTHLPPMKSLSG
jgi:hypothetical protein